MEKNKDSARLYILNKHTYTQVQLMTDTGVTPKTNEHKENKKSQDI